LIPVLAALFRWAVAERMGTIILSALVAHTSWHWLVERAERLRQFELHWPSWTAAQWATLLSWLLAIVSVAGVVWLVFTLLAGQAIRLPVRFSRLGTSETSAPPKHP